MHDLVPPPYGHVTRRWTQLTDGERQGHARRLVGVGLADAGVDRPDDTTAHHYRQVVAAAVDGDPIAFAWLATSHRPQLLNRGRALFEDDPAEWGAVCLEALHTTLMRADPAIGRWLRRQVSLQLMTRVDKATARHLRRRSTERATDPVRLSTYHPAVADPDPNLDLSVRLTEVLGRLDPATRDGFHALADQEPLADVAHRHHLPHATLKKRLVRARPRLQAQLTAYRRGPVR